MRVCIIGGGLAGALLTWRLARATHGWRLDLVPGERCDRDATSASGGAVRAYESDAEQRRLAIASLRELLDSRTLRAWSQFREADSVYLRQRPDGLAAVAAEIEAALPGSAEVVAGEQLRDLGWHDVPAEAAALVEHTAGYTSPRLLRDAVLGDNAVRRRVSVLRGRAAALTPLANGTVRCEVAGQLRRYDAVVVAAGAWTAALLHASTLPVNGYRTKSIQYAIHPCAAWRPPMFVDELLGLYGRPTANGGLLLGVPTELWDVDPDRPPDTAQLHDTAAALARRRFPNLQIGAAAQRVGSADCYTEPPHLSLRLVLDTAHRLFTFSGGSGGSVKTALAASDQAATQLVESAQSTALAPV